MTQTDPQSTRILERIERAERNFHAPEIGDLIEEVAACRPLNEELCHFLFVSLDRGFDTHRYMALDACLALREEAAPLLEVIYAHFHTLLPHALALEALTGLHPFFPSIEDRMRAFLQDPVYEHKANAVRTLRMLPSISPATCEALMQQLDPDAQDRHTLELYHSYLYALARHSPPTEALWQRVALCKDKYAQLDPIARMGLMFNLQRMGFPRHKTLPFLRHFLLDEPNPIGAKTAAVALHRDGSQEAAAILTEGLERLVAIFAPMGFNSSQDLFESILPVIHRAPSVIPTLVQGLNGRNPIHSQRIARLLARFTTLPDTLQEVLIEGLNHPARACAHGAALAIIELYPFDQKLLHRMMDHLAPHCWELQRSVSFPLPPPPQACPDFLLPAHARTSPRAKARAQEAWEAIPEDQATVLIAFFPQALENKTLRAARIAAEIIAKLDKEAQALIFPRLQELLQDPHTPTRRRAIQLIECFGMRALRFLPILGEALQDPSARVRLQALRALTPFGKHAMPFVPKIARRLYEPGYQLRKAAQECLRELSLLAPPSLADTLQRLIRSNDWTGEPKITTSQLRHALQTGPFDDAQRRTLALIFATRTVWHYQNQKRPPDPDLLTWFAQHKSTTPPPTAPPPPKPHPSRDMATTDDNRFYEARLQTHRCLLAALHEDPAHAVGETMQALLHAARCSEEVRWGHQKHPPFRRERAWILAKALEVLLAPQPTPTDERWKEQLEDILF